MSLTVKAFLHEHTWRGDPKEIRRFTIDQDVSTSYAYLLEKIAQVFPSVQAGSVVVAWMGKCGIVHKPSLYLSECFCSNFAQYCSTLLITIYCR